MRLRRYAKGGTIRGPVAYDDDSVPAILSRGCYYPETLRHAFPEELLEALNSPGGTMTAKTAVATAEPERRGLLQAVRDLLERARRLR